MTDDTGMATDSGHDKARQPSQLVQAGDVKTAAPVLPDAFWESETLQDAFLARHFGQLMKAYRSRFEPPLRQTDLAAWLGLTQGQVSRIERSRSSVTDLKRLTTWALLLHIPAKYLWFNPDSQGCTSDATSPIMGTGQPEEEDVRRRTLIKSFGLGASLLVLDQPDRGIASPDPLQHAIGPADVEVIKELTRSFRRLDNRFGGGHAFSVVDNYLASHVGPTLRSGRFTSSLRPALFIAAAELYQLAGWMAYDVGDHDRGHAHLHTALKLCEDVRCDSLAAEMLAAMSHQASFNRHANSAVELAGAASYAARATGISELRAEAAVMEAHGLALRGEQRACIAALQRAEQFFIQGNDTTRPEWLSYFDEAYLSAKFGHTLRDLNRPNDAERFARKSLQMTDGYERGRLFNTALLAGILADQGNFDEAVHNAQLAVQMSGSMRSVRTTAYLVDTYRRLVPCRKSEMVRSLRRSMIATGVPASALVV